MSDIRVLEQRAMEIRRRYDAIAKAHDERPWDVQQLAEGFKGDVEELIEILSKKTVNPKRLNHELADCLWSVLVIARKLDVDIERAFWATMEELDERLRKEQQ